MNYKEFTELDNFFGVHIICGDNFLLDKCVQFAMKKLNISNNFDISIFDSENFSAQKVMESCEQVSFFTQNKFVIVKNVFSVQESDKKKLNDYAKKINPACCLVIIDNQNVFSFLKVAKWNITISDSELSQTVMQFATENGKKLSFQNATYLIELAGKDLYKLKFEVDKLCAFSLQAEITKDDLDLLVTKNDDVVVFELTSALGEKNADKSLKILDNLLKKEPMPSKLLALMSNNFSRLFTVAVSKNLDNSVLAQKLDIHPYAVTKLKMQLKNFSPKKLKDILYECCEVEYMIKSGLMQTQTALYFLALYILNI